MRAESGTLLTLRCELGANNPNGQASAPRDRVGTKISMMGSIDDIGAIGNGNVGCNKSVGQRYSLEKQVALGKQIFS
jgi:hypothetical protein